MTRNTHPPIAYRIAQSCPEHRAALRRYDSDSSHHCPVKPACRQIGWWERKGLVLDSVHGLEPFATALASIMLTWVLSCCLSGLGALFPSLAGDCIEPRASLCSAVVKASLKGQHHIGCRSPYQAPAQQGQSCKVIAWHFSGWMLERDI